MYVYTLFRTRPAPTTLWWRFPGPYLAHKKQLAKQSGALVDEVYSVAPNDCVMVLTMVWRSKSDYDVFFDDPALRAILDEMEAYEKRVGIVSRRIYDDTDAITV